MKYCCSNALCRITYLITISPVRILHLRGLLHKLRVAGIELEVTAEVGPLQILSVVSGLSKIKTNKDLIKFSI